MARDAEIRLRANDRELDASLDKARSKMRGKFLALGRDLAGQVSGALRSGLNMVGIGGIAAIAAAGRHVYEFQKGLVRLQISASKSKSEIEGLSRRFFEI